jgi:hypothetical protein
MIYTRHGTEVTILGAERDGDTTWVKIRRPDGSEREFNIWDLVADGGMDEIVNTINQIAANEEQES